MAGCVQVVMPANSRIEYKYVILEEQVGPLAPLSPTKGCARMQGGARGLPRKRALTCAA